MQMYACTSSRRENPHNFEHRHLLPLLAHKLTFDKMRPPRHKMIYNLQPVQPQFSNQRTTLIINAGTKHSRRRRLPNISRIFNLLCSADIVVHPARNLAASPNFAHRLFQIVNSNVARAYLDGYPYFTRRKTREPVVASHVEVGPA